MSQFDDIIFDVLMYVIFLKGFVQVEFVWVVMVDGVDYLFW